LRAVALEPLSEPEAVERTRQTDVREDDVDVRLVEAQELDRFLSVVGFVDLVLVVAEKIGKREADQHFAFNDQNCAAGNGLGGVVCPYRLTGHETRIPLGNVSGTSLVGSSSTGNDPLLILRNAGPRNRFHRVVLQNKRNEASAHPSTG